jgi:hypothetical protein
MAEIDNLFKCNPPRVQVETIAEAFAANLRQRLSPADHAEMKRRNRTNAYEKSGSCASHDFCDANMEMAAAFQRIEGREFDTTSDADHAVWNQAWEIARQKFIGTAR